MDLSKRNRKVAISRWKKHLIYNQSRIYSGKDVEVMKAALCGFLAGDGSVQVRKGKSFSHYQLDFFPDDIRMLKKYLSLMKRVYKTIPSITRRDNVFAARLFQKFIVLDLLKISKFGVYNWNIPNWIMKNDLNKKAWLRAFFSAEGYVNQKYIKTQSVNLIGISKVSHLLDSMDISHRVYYYKPKNTNHSKVALLFISPFKSRIKFYKEIGFWHLKKERKLRETLGL